MKKSAEEMRIRYWSSDVCSSDMHIEGSFPKPGTSGGGRDMRMVKNGGELQESNLAIEADTPGSRRRMSSLFSTSPGHGNGSEPLRRAVMRRRRRRGSPH